MTDSVEDSSAESSAPFDLTPAMIEAGSVALDEALLRHDYTSPVGPYTRQQIAREVFTAMAGQASHGRR